MSFHAQQVNTNPDGAPHLRPKVNASPSPITMASYSQGGTEQVPHQPHATTMQSHGFGQAVAMPHVNGPGVGFNAQQSRAHAPNRAQLHPQNALEDQLRHMVLQNDPLPGHPPTTSASSSTGNHPQTSTPGNFRRLNQTSRRQQAQQKPSAQQHIPTTTSMAELRQPGQVPYYEPRSSADLRGHHHQPISKPPQYDINQRRPYGPIAQPRSLYDPNNGGSRGREVRPGNRVQIADNQAQLGYIDRLAKTKILEVEISPEEISEKQTLKERLNEICRKTVLDYELGSDPEFTLDGVELKAFGSMSVGFATRESDMDLVLVSPHSKPELSSSNSLIPRMVEKALMDLGYGARLLTQTRVPIIKFCESPGAELAAHLRLTRLHWEKEMEMNHKEADSNTKEESPKASAETLESLQLQEIPDQSPSARNEDILEDDKETKSGIPPLIETDGRATVRGNTENDCAWVSSLTNYELTGLFKIALKENRCDPHQKAIVSASLECLEGQSASKDSSLVQKSREALLSFSEVIKKCRVPGREDLDFPNSGVGTQCDINFSNQLALQNSLLLKCYATCDPRVRQMVLFVKAWTKRRKINSPYHGTLNSYGYVLMVLHFLMNVARPPLIHNLQLATDMIRNDSLSSREVSLDGHNIQFFRNEAALQEMAHRGMFGFGQNQESLGSLLRSFFQFYANPPYGTFSWKDDVMSLRTKGGILKKVGKGWVGARTEMVDLGEPGQGQKKVNHHYVVAIEDPFETSHNVARTVFFNGVVAIRDEFRRAADLILRAGMDPQRGLQDFFAEGKRNENLQQRHGPFRKDAGQNNNNSPAKNDVSGKALSLKKDEANQEAGPNTKESIPLLGPENGKIKMDKPIPKS